MYRNIVLTIIAVCLVYICARDLAPWQPARAGERGLIPKADKPVPVKIEVDERNPLPVSMDLSRAGRISVVVEDVRSGALRAVEPIAIREGR